MPDSLVDSPAPAGRVRAGERAGLVTVADHLDLVMRTVAVLPAESCPLDGALGRTLREPVRGVVALPAFDNSAMDGFAVHFADVAQAAPSRPASLRVVADLPAGTAEDPPLPAGTAARIMTGAPVPTDADTVVPFEDTADGLAGSLIRTEVVRVPRDIGAHIRRRGEDVRRGDDVILPGEVLGPLHLAAAAAVGVHELVVTRTPRVAVISTGSELVEPGTPLQPGQIPESNSRMLAALAVEAGCRVIRRTSVPDDGVRLAGLVAELTDASAAEPVDVVILSGGVSAGAFEVVKQTFSDTILFTRVAMRPGTPQAFGRLPGGAVVFGLPGNPVSAAVSFEVFARPALLRMQGRAQVNQARVSLPVTAGWTSPLGREQYVPVAIDRAAPDRWTARPAGPGGSHRAGALARADGYAVIPAHVGEMAAGALVDVLLTS